MKRALGLISLLATVLIVALVLRVHHLRAASHGPAGGSGVIEGVDVNVTSRISTRIAKVLVREGDIVKQGDLVVELDCTEEEAALSEQRARLAAAQATLDAANESARSALHSATAGYENVSASRAQLAVLEAQEAQALRDLQRTERLTQAGAATIQALDDARTRHQTLVDQIAAQRATEGATRSQAGALSSTGSAMKAQMTAAQKSLDAAQASLAREEVSERECKLYAPRSAMVATRILEPGEAVQPGTNILLLTDVTEARTRFYLPNAELGAAAPGRKVRVVADAYPGQDFYGTIYYVSPSAEFTPRNVQTREDRERLVYAVEVRIPNTDMKLRSGMPVEVSIEGSWE